LRLLNRLTFPLHNSGLPDFFLAHTTKTRLNTPNDHKICMPNDHKIYQNVHKIYHMIRKYTKWSQNIPKLSHNMYDKRSQNIPNDHKTYHDYGIYQTAIKIPKGPEIYKTFLFQGLPKYAKF
jgi:hypothetical protein